MTRSDMPRATTFNTPLPPQHDESHPALFAEAWALFADTIPAPAPPMMDIEPALFEITFIDRASLEFKLS